MMRNALIYLIATILFSFPHFSNASVTDSLSGPGIVFETLDYDFGDLIQGEKTEHIYFFTNTGDQPLIIDNVLSTCGCTVPEWTEKPVPPGGKGSIKVLFDSSGKIGRQHKIITIRSNAVGNPHKVKIFGMVLPPEK